MKLADDPIVKTCFKCGEPKLLKEFYKHPQMKDGHVNKCKECNKKDVSQNYADRREQYAEYERERWQRPDRRAAAIEYQRKRRARHPEKYAARTAVGNALRDGTIQKQPCKCGSLDVQAHHEDYSKPLEVDWLCRKCHLAEHGKVAYKKTA